MVIVCEGKKTEHNYFLALRKELALTAVIVLPSHQATDPPNLIRQAHEERQRLATEKQWPEKSSAWAVFDGDEHIANDPQQWKDAIQFAQGKRLDLAINNPCFEFWYLQHFDEYNANLSRKRALEELMKHIADYDKAMTDIYPIKIGKETTRTAIERARKLAKRAEENGLPFYENPCAGVCEPGHRLFEISAAMYPEKRDDA